MKKFFLVSLFFLGVFLVASIKAGNAHAAAYLSADLSNTAGDIPVTVTYHFISQFGEETTVRSTTIARGGTGVAADFHSPDAGGYKMSYEWTCHPDPIIDPTYVKTLTENDTSYNFGNLDVHCRTTGEPSITSSDCTADTFSASWALVGGSNVDHFAIFFANSWDNGVIDSSFVGNVPASTRSWSRGGLSPGNYGFRVSAVSPQGAFSAPAYAYATCQPGPGPGPTPPPPGPGPTPPPPIVPIHTLTVSISGNGRGTVTSSLTGINCSNIAGGPTDCSEPYDDGTPVTLTATADTNTNSVFGSWTGDVCNGSTSITCSLFMNGPKNVTATFNLKTTTPTPTGPCPDGGGSCLRVEKPTCSDGPYQSRVTFRWDNASDGSWWLDIATWDMRVLNTFGGHIQLPKGALSTPPPAGYTLNPDTDYFWRIWPGRDPHVYPAEFVYYPFKVLSCPKGTLNLNGFPGSDCTGTPPKYYVDLSWSDTAPPGGSHYYVFWRSQAGGGTVFVFQGVSPPNPVRDNNVSANTVYTYQLQDQRDGRVSPSINVRTLACVANKPDLTVTIESLTPANPPKPNDPVTVTGKVTNIGAATPQGQGFFVWFWDDQAAAPGCPPVDRDGSVFVSSLAAGDSQPFNYAFNAPAPPGAKTFWAFADGGCNIEESNETNNTASRAYTVGAVATPPPPGIMSVTLTANGQKVAVVPAGSTVTLAWVTSVSPRPQACVGFSAPSNDDWAGSKNRLGGTQQLVVSVNTTFSITCTLGNNFKTDSVQVIVTAVQPAGLGSCTIAPASAAAGTATTFTWTVTDSLQSGSGTATYTLNWGDFGAPTVLASPWQKVASFNQAHTYSAGGVYAPSVTIFGPPAAVPATRGPFFCGAVGVASGGGAWFETQAGDVGSSGGITLKTAPPAGKYQSTYLLAGEDLTNVKVAPGGWSVRGYSGPLVPVGGVYNWLAARFLAQAKEDGQAACTISAGGLPEKKKFGYCASDGEFSAGNAPNGDQVWFIDGSLTIKKDLKLGAKDTITFIVRGNITIGADVTQTDGIYVAGGTFAASDTGGAGKQLTVNGAVLAQVLNLNRILADKNCGVSPCDNSVHPAERVVFDPKYLVGLNSVLGSPQVAWREVAP